MNHTIFEWDTANRSHIAEHGVIPAEAEQVIQNRPCDLESQLRSGEERTVQIGETDGARILVVVTTMLGKKIRVVTAWPAKERLRLYFLTQKRNGNVGRTEKENLRK
jgi:uncharacterized DUF497 family protein